MKETKEEMKEEMKETKEEIKETKEKIKETKKEETKETVDEKVCIIPATPTMPHPPLCHAHCATPTMPRPLCHIHYVAGDETCERVLV